MLTQERGQAVRANRRARKRRRKALEGWGRTPIHHMQPCLTAWGDGAAEPGYSQLWARAQPHPPALPAPPHPRLRAQSVPETAAGGTTQKYHQPLAVTVPCGGRGAGGWGAVHHGAWGRCRGYFQPGGFRLGGMAAPLPGLAWGSSSEGAHQDPLDLVVRVVRSFLQGGCPSGLDWEHRQGAGGLRQGAGGLIPLPRAL